MANLKDIDYGIGKYLELSDASGIPDIGTNRTNLDLLNFKVATNNAYALYNFKDGMIDAYVDETGVDTGTSTNETYNATEDLYSPTGGNTNMTLVSNAQTAQADPAEGRLVLYEEDVDSITLDTDIKGYVSRDGGTTYTQTPLAEDTVYDQFGIDSNTKLMLHCDGANDGTTFTDSSDNGFTVTAVGNAHTDTAVKKFGTASYQGDGTGDGLSVAYNANLQMGSGDFTVDFWIRFDDQSHTTYGYARVWGWWSDSTTDFSYLLQRRPADGGNVWRWSWTTDGTTGTRTEVDFSWTTAANDTWYHVALVRNGTTAKMYIDGTALSGTATMGTQVIYDGGDPTEIGVVDGPGSSLQGYLDEFRISKGVARWTANFTPPTSSYGVRRLLSGSVDISGQPSGTDMKYKVETLNSKNLKLHGASLLWA